jgi:Domain of unknown function (DUF4304)
VSERDPVQLAFDQFGKEAGFEKKSGSWYRRADEVISVSNLQKSQYGSQYYFNQAFWLRQFGDERSPKENKCHIRARLGSLLPDQAGAVERLLDLDHQMPDEQRIEQLVGLLREQLLPIIERGETVAGLRGLLDEGAFKAAGIRGPAQEALAAVS